MADDTAPQDATVDTDNVQPETGEATEPVNEWKDKFEGQRKVNRDLERKLRETEKANEQVRLASMTEAEKAVELARAETRAETLRTVGGRLVDAEVRAASAGRLDAEQVEALLEMLDRSRFITDDGDVDRDQIAAHVARFAPAGPRRPSGDVGQGARTNSQPSTASQFASALEGFL